MMKTLITFLLALQLGLPLIAQQHKLDPTSGHYKDFEELSGAPNPTYAWMDTVKFAGKEFGQSITYLLSKPRYMDDSQIEKIIGALTPPANSSERVRKELDYLLELQKNRTAEQIERVNYLGNIGYWPAINLVPSHPLHKQNLADLFFEGRTVLGEEINDDHFPKLSKLLQGVMQDMRLVEFKTKYRYLRPRPYQLDTTLRPLMRMTSPSLASGHTLWAFLQAYVWCEIAPEKSEKFIELAEEIRRSREIMGIHYPSDNETARRMAHEMLQVMFTNKAFAEDFLQAKLEWKKLSPKYINK